MLWVSVRSWTKRLGLVAAASVAAIGAAQGATGVGSLGDLPPVVSKIYESSCAPDFWAGGQRRMDGSTTDTFSDGTRVFLLVCGDAASVAPYSAIVLLPSGEAREAKFQWQFKGKDFSDSGLSNAYFGNAADTVGSSAHSSASCEPEYMHHWNGDSFDLIHVKRTGCRADE